MYERETQGEVSLYYFVLNFILAGTFVLPPVLSSRTKYTKNNTIEPRLHFTTDHWLSAASGIYSAMTFCLRALEYPLQKELLLVQPVESTTPGLY